MRRRDFITLLGGAAAWPVAVRAQQASRMRRIGVLVTAPEDDTEMSGRLTAFHRGLEALGWIEGKNVQFDVRWRANERDRAGALMTELLGLSPDLVVVGNPVPLEAAVQQTRAVPVLFLSLSDPVEAGYVESYAHPGGNVTGFTNFETQTAAKWIELLKEIAPATKRAMVMMRSPASATTVMRQGVIEAAALSLGVKMTFQEVHDAPEIAAAIETFAHERNSGLIVSVGPILAFRDTIIAQAARNRLPAVYPYRFYADDGGLLSYGVDGVDIYRRGASYADRILRGEKPADLPIQSPTKYELVVNRGTAKAMALDVPTSILLRADEVIE